MSSQKKVEEITLDEETAAEGLTSLSPTPPKVPRSLVPPPAPKAVRFSARTKRVGLFVARKFT